MHVRRAIAFFTKGGFITKASLTSTTIVLVAITDI